MVLPNALIFRKQLKSADDLSMLLIKNSKYIVHSIEEVNIEKQIGS